MADRLSHRWPSGPIGDRSEPVEAQPLTWIIGAGGLLGSALNERLRRQGRACFTPAAPWAWDRPEQLPAQLRLALSSFREQLGPGRHWEIHWTAGRGAMASAAAELEADRIAFQALLQALADDPQLPRHPGLLVLASSAGGLHAGSPVRLIDEDTPPQPNNPYGRWKLEQEQLTRQLVAAGYADAAFIGRISSLYGVARGRSQRPGLIRTLARQLLRRQPVRIFVPLDTMRDYLAVEDAVTMILAGAQQGWGQVMRGGSSSCLTRLVTSEQPTAISELLGIFRRLTRRMPLIVTSSSGPVHLYGRCVRYRSRVLPELQRLVTTPLPLGIAAVLEAERRALAGPLPR